MRQEFCSNPGNNATRNLIRIGIMSLKVSFKYQFKTLSEFFYNFTNFFNVSEGFNFIKLSARTLTLLKFFENEPQVSAVKPFVVKEEVSNLTKFLLHVRKNSKSYENPRSFEIFVWILKLF